MRITTSFSCPRRIKYFPVSDRGLVAGVLAIGILLIAPVNVTAQQQAGEVLSVVRAYRTASEAEILDEYRRFLSIPNVASDTPNIRRNAEHLLGMLQQRGIASRLLDVEGAPPYVFGEVRQPGAELTIVFYAHYDGQPVDPSAWASDPWVPILREGVLGPGVREIPFPRPGGMDREPLDPELRIYCRSVSDDKAPIVALLTAWDALAAADIRPSINIIFFFEGEEEAGSPHIRKALETYKDLLEADLWIFCDGPVNQSRRPEVAFGVRGIVGVQMTVYGPLRHLHSGHYGNWAPNPTVMLTHLLSGMRDEEGTILVDGIYDDVRPITLQERQAIDAMPAIEKQMIEELGLGRTEGGAARLPELIMRPAMNFSGFQAGGVGSQARNAVPSEARAYIDFRLVPDLKPEKVQVLVERHIEQRGFHIVHTEPDLDTRLGHEKVIRLDWGDGYPAVRTSMDLPVSRTLIAVAREVAGESLVEVPTHGGSLPMNVFREVLKRPLIILPIVNHDNNQHGANENLRLQNLWDGIEMFGQVMARFGVVYR